MSAPRSWWVQALARFASQQLTLLAAGVLLVICLVALGAPLFAPFDPAEQFRKDGFSAAGLPVGPNAQFFLGTDALGRDMLSRLIYGARISIGISLVASTLAVLVGLVVGSVAGMSSQLIDTLLMRFVDIVMSLPSFFVILLLVILLQPSIWITVLVVAILGWTYPARIFRAEVGSIRERDYVLAARSLGVPSWRILVRHILPQMLPLVVVYLTLGVPAAMFTEAGLSFLGLGVPPPAPAWGSMIQTGVAYYRAAPLQVLLPGAALMVTIICFNLVGSGLRDALDPTTR